MSTLVIVHVRDVAVRDGETGSRWSDDWSTGDLRYERDGVVVGCRLTLHTDDGATTVQFVGDVADVRRLFEEAFEATSRGDRLVSGDE